MSEEEEDIDEEERNNERQKLKNLGVGSTWDLLTGKKKNED